ncbi:uncharacterized protein [Phaseolus vulgaris]|uniref:uncharacterized protein isoform X2 n=1 Tax=Phaseolus vulgaris TaxID=3885 RepID=UPI0035C9D1C3
MEGDAGEVDDLVMEHKVFRNYCRTTFLGVVNKRLTDEQKSFIQSTPFAWVMLLGDKVKMSRTLLRELCSRWVERRQSFLIRCEVVPLSLVDVCLGLGLRVVGEKIDLHKAADESHTKTLFESNNINVKMIFDEIMKFDNDGCIEDFCRLYILLCLSEFLLPNRMGIVHSGLFSVLDDLGQLKKFNWGLVVYEYLVNSLCSASMCITNESSTSHIHIFGCVYLLQIWALEHLFSYKTKVHPRRIKFPRILNWMDFTLGDHEIAYALEKNLDNMNKKMWEIKKMKKRCQMKKVT